MEHYKFLALKMIINIFIKNINLYRKTFDWKPVQIFDLNQLSLDYVTKQKLKNNKILQLRKIKI